MTTCTSAPANTSTRRVVSVTGPVQLSSSLRPMLAKKCCDRCGDVCRPCLAASSQLKLLLRTTSQFRLTSLSLLSSAAGPLQTQSVPRLGRRAAGGPISAQCPPPRLVTTGSSRQNYPPIYSPADVCNPSSLSLPARN